MIPPRLAPIAFGLILSCMMSLIISGVSTLRAYGMEPGFFAVWVTAWLPSWVIAFPAVTILAPMTRKIVGKMTRV